MRLTARMRARLDEAGGWRVNPMAHGMNPKAMVCGFGADLGSYPQAGLHRRHGDCRRRRADRAQSAHRAAAARMTGAGMG
jgi:hypothetical protein